MIDVHEIHRDAYRAGYEAGWAERDNRLSAPLTELIRLATYAVQHTGLGDPLQTDLRRAITAAEEAQRRTA